MGGWVYFKLVLWATGRGVVDLAQAIIFLAVALAGAAILIGARFGLDVNASGLTSLVTDPKSVVVLVGSLIITRLIIAPYWVWRDERNAREEERQSNRGMSMRELVALNDHTSAIREQTEEQRIQRESAGSIEEDYPTLRVADCLEAVVLFKNYDPKLTGLLSSGSSKRGQEETEILGSCQSDQTYGKLIVSSFMQLLTAIPRAESTRHL